MPKNSYFFCYYIDACDIFAKIYRANFFNLKNLENTSLKGYISEIISQIKINTLDFLVFAKINLKLCRYVKNIRL